MRKHDEIPNYEELSQARFSLYVHKTNSCWIWTGSINKNGYGQFHYQRKTWRVHRLLYTWKKGIVPLDKELHHTCQNKICVNPDHLELINKIDHSKYHGQIREKADECPQGHQFNEKNTGRSKSGRYCRICTNQRRGNWRESRRKEGKKVT